MTTDESGLADSRLACTPPTHLLATNNPWHGVTYCVCGEVRIPSREVNHSTWHERFVYDHAGKAAQVIGYQRFMLDVCLCHPNGTAQKEAS